LHHFWHSGCFSLSLTQNQVLFAVPDSVQAHGFIKVTEVSSLILSFPVLLLPTKLSCSGHRYLPSMSTFSGLLMTDFH
jgi:hypothetical protein